MKLFTSTKSYSTIFESKSLTELANVYQTDKGNADKFSFSWGNKWPELFCWGYTTTYEKYMYKFREKNIKLFEVGIRDPRFPYASCKMWLSYFKDIELYGMDNFWGKHLDEMDNEISQINEFGINFIYADQGNFLDWDKIKKECPNDFDFFIEDGSHWPNHMMVTLWQAKDLLKPGGIYFMEDIQNPKRSRGKFKCDNSMVAEDLLEAQYTNYIDSRFLNEKQNMELNDSFKLVELVLDKTKNIYLGVFIKK